MRERTQSPMYRSLAAEAVAGDVHGVTGTLPLTRPAAARLRKTANRRRRRLAVRWTGQCRSPWFGRCQIPPWVRLTTGPKRWTLERTACRRRRTRLFHVFYAVELLAEQRLTCSPPERIRLTADPVIYVLGRGRAGCRMAKRVARRLRQSPADVDLLPPDRFHDWGERPAAGVGWWMVYEVAGD